MSKGVSNQEFLGKCVRISAYLGCILPVEVDSKHLVFPHIAHGPAVVTIPAGETELQNITSIHSFKKSNCGVKHSPGKLIGCQIQ